MLAAGLHPSTSRCENHNRCVGLLEEDVIACLTVAHIPEFKVVIVVGVLHACCLCSLPNFIGLRSYASEIVCGQAIQTFEEIRYPFIFGRKHGADNKLHSQCLGVIQQFAGVLRSKPEMSAWVPQPGISQQVTELCC